MKLNLYLKERLLGFSFLMLVLVAIEGFGILLELPLGFLVFTGVGFIGSWLCVWTADYFRRRNFYRQAEENVKYLDKKYLVPELMESPDFLEGRLFYDCMKEMEISMLEHVGEYKRSSREYKEYVELWVHEIKLPIATGKMILENHKEGYSESLLEELEKIDNYTEQALFYARSNYVEKDYLLNKVNLKDITGEVIRKYKKELLSVHFSIELENLDCIVYSDSKWLQFILGQILSNSIKYAGETRKIWWQAKQEKETIKLVLEDWGLGISAKDVVRVFEKGFTGNNGRENLKSTGIGLYLCKKLCEKMGHQIFLESLEGKGCKVTILFPKGSMTSFLDSGETY